MGRWGADFDPDRLADLETALWKAYDRRQPARLFGLLTQELRAQAHASWPWAPEAGGHGMGVRVQIRSATRDEPPLPSSFVL